jgi:hypothetical protein
MVRRYQEVWRTQREPSDERFAELLHRAFSENWTERLMQELGLYRKEREAGRWADALLEFRRSLTFSRRVESEISERWLVAFDGDDPRVAEIVSSRLASAVVDAFDDDRRNDRERDELDSPVGPALQLLRERIWAAKAKISRWEKTHDGGTVPAALMKDYEALMAKYLELLEEVVDRVGQRERTDTLSVRPVKTPRVSEGRVSPLLLHFVGAGALAGLLIGLFTMPLFLWWRRHLP